MKEQGVILGCPLDWDSDMRTHVVSALTNDYPGVRFVLLPGVQSVAFEYESDE